MRHSGMTSASAEAALEVDTEGHGRPDTWGVESKTQASLELQKGNSREIYVSQDSIARVVFSLGFMFLPIKPKDG